jgi:tight adherence protein C
MPTWSRCAAWACELALAGCLGAIAYALQTMPPRALLGERGLRRHHARAQGLLARALEPWLSATRPLLARLPLGGARASIELRLLRSGNPLGLSADEALALGLLSAGLTSLLADRLGPDGGALPSCAGFVLGVALPIARLLGQAQERQRRVDRELPAAIDVVALCMGAGLDFAAALRQWLSGGKARRSALDEELETVVRGLAIGMTRRSALEGFAHAVPSAAVVDFVHAVAHADQRGTPLAAVIATQARSLRLRRSIAAEEAAARAGVWMMLPLLLLLAAIMLVMFAPFILGAAGL